MLWSFAEVIEQLSMSNTKKTEVSKAKDFMMFVKVHCHIIIPFKYKNVMTPLAVNLCVCRFALYNLHQPACDPITYMEIKMGKKHK